MINKIGQSISLSKSNSISNKHKNSSNSANNVSQNPIQSAPFNSALLQHYYVSFGQKESIEKEKFLKANYTHEAGELIDASVKIAQKYGHKEVAELHVMKAALESINQYIDDLDSGEKTFSKDSGYALPNNFESMISSELFEKKELRAKTKPIIENEIISLDNALKEMPKSTSSIFEKRKLSKNLVNKIVDLHSVMCAEADADLPISDSAIFGGVLYTDIDKPDSRYNKFLFNLCEKIMLDERKPEDKIHLKIYDDKARNILKNLSLGTNMFVTYDEKANPSYLFNSIESVLDDGENFGKLNRENTDITILNKQVKETYLLQKMSQLAKDKEKTHIIMVDQNEMLKNDIRMVKMEDGTTKAMGAYSPEFISIMKNLPKNIKLVFSETKNAYYANMTNSTIQKMFEDFGELSFPIMSTEQAKKAFREQPLLMKKIDKPFKRSAVDKAIEIAAPLDGTFPEKAQKLLKRISSYYVDNKNEITEKEVISYIDQAKDSFKLTGDDSSVDVVFDTGKKLKDILGKESTRKEAEGIVKQIKNGTLGTKGAIIYSQDGSVGSGRKFTAKAIAGESKSPYVEINALDFGTKEVDIFGGGALSPESSIKKLFSLVKAQADANPNKSAVLFIENFEYFSVGELVSEYHQKAMSQLLREMDNASKKGLNILVLGSVSNPDLIGESTIKSFKFIDRIEVETPSMNINARKEILSNAIKERKIKIAGDTEDEKKEIIKLMAETTEGFPFVYLINMVDKSKTVAFERGHKQVEKADVVEAYLQLTTGRPASGPIREHEKKMTTSHECGHALTSEIMSILAEKQNIPWHLPNKVNFITLDPRGYYGGAMYSKEGENHERSLETIFAGIVCDYGGHSAEKLFYNMDGSYGITIDLEMATNAANNAVRYMGQGYHTGKMSVGGMHEAPTGRIKNNMDKDVDVILKNSLLISDLITEVYADFNKEFTEKYYHLVGTGECLIQGDQFREDLAKWIAKQPKEKQDEIEALDRIILAAIDATKKGKQY